MARCRLDNKPNNILVDATNTTQLTSLVTLEMQNHWTQQKVLMWDSILLLYI